MLERQKERDGTGRTHLREAKERRCFALGRPRRSSVCAKINYKLINPDVPPMLGTASKVRLLVCHGDGEGEDSNGGWKETGYQQPLWGPG